MRRLAALLGLTLASACTSAAAPTPRDADEEPPAREATRAAATPEPVPELTAPAAPAMGALDVEPPAPAPASEPNPEPKPASAPAAEPAPVVEAEPAREAPVTSAQIVVTAYEPTWEEENVFFCPFDARPRGFPAIDPSGAAVVTARVEVSGGSEGEDAVLALRWLDVATGEETRRVEIYDAADLEHAATDAVDPCAAYRETVARRARQINRELERGGWRPMQALDVHISGDERERVDLLAIPAQTRPVELLWRDSAIVARVPRVKLFVNEPAPWYGTVATNSDDMACEADPQLARVYGDRQAGLLAIEYRNESPQTSCLCDVRTETGLIPAPDALFERLATAR